MTLAGGTPTVTVNALGTGKSAAISAAVAGSSGLVKAGAGTLTLGGTNTLGGNVTISAGTLALGSGGSISNVTSISLAAGTTFDVSAQTGYNLSSSTTLNAGGTGTGTNAATIRGGTTVNLGSQPVGLTFTPAVFTGDTTHPALYVSAGTLLLTNNAFTVTNAAGTPLGAGNYTLIQQAGGSVGGVVSNSTVLVTGSGVAAGAVALLSLNASNVNLVVVTNISTLSWAVGNGNWDINTTANWKSGAATGLTYQNGESVIFDDTASGAAPILVTNVPTVSPTNVTANVTNKSYLVSGSAIAGATSLTVNGSGTLTLANTNTYTGGTLINGGNLQLGDGTARNGVVAGPITDDGTLTVSNATVQVFTNLISGGGSLLEAGGANLVLNAANSYSDGTFINNGTVVVSNAYALGSGTVTINAVRLIVADGLTVTNNIQINNGSSTGRGAIENSGTGNATFGGGIITLNNAEMNDFANANGTSGSLTIMDPIVASPNLTTCIVVARAGTVLFGGGGSYNSLYDNNGLIELAADNGICTTASLSLSIGGGYSTFDLLGYSQTLTGMSGVAGLSTIKNGSMVNNSTLTLAGSSTYAGVISDGTESLLLNIVGGTTTLSGANTYHGATTINGGTLALANGGSIGNSPSISIAAGATFDVSAYASYNFNSGATLNASGNGTAVGTNAAVIKGGTTVNLASQPISLTYTPAGINGDATHPALYISAGTLLLTNNAFTVNNASGIPLGSGTYTLIQQAGGNIGGSVSNSLLSIAGAGLATGGSASLVMSGGSVNLVVNIPNLTWTTTTGSIVDGSGTWNQGSPSVTPGNGAWYNNSAGTYFNTMSNGDYVTFGGGTSGAAGIVTIGAGGVTPGNIVLNAGNGGGNYAIGASTAIRPSR